MEKNEASAIRNVRANRRVVEERAERAASGKIGLASAKLCEKRPAASSNVLIFASRWEIINVDAAFETAVTRRSYRALTKDRNRKNVRKWRFLPDLSKNLTLKSGGRVKWAE